MSKWYSHLIEIESIVVELDQLDLTNEQKKHLASLVDESLHHTILDAILTELSEEDKRIFLKHVASGSHDQIWQFLFDKVDKIEDKIKKAAEDLKTELHDDLKEARQRRGSP